MKRNHTLLYIAILIVLMLVVYFLSGKHVAHAPTGSTTGTSTAQDYPTLTSSSTKLKIGDHIIIGTALVTPTQIVSDNRCAIGLQCFQAGTVIVALNVSTEDSASVVNLELNKSQTVGDHVVTLTTVTPSPKPRGDIDPADYTFTLGVQ